MTRAGLRSKWSITISFGSSSWSMWTPISSVIAWTISGQLLLHALVDRLLGARRARSFHSPGCSRCMISSTIAGISGANIETMCSAIWSGSSCW